VCRPEEAYKCLMRTHMDYLVMGSFVVAKTDQKPLEQDTNWMKEFELD
jgi:carbamoyltransferase